MPSTHAQPRLRYDADDDCDAPSQKFTVGMLDRIYVASPEAGIDEPERTVIICEPAGQATLAAVQVVNDEDDACKHESLSSEPSLT